MLAQDFPKPAFETSGPYLEAAALSAKLREAPRPERPLRVVIAGAGEAAQHWQCNNTIAMSIIIIANLLLTIPAMLFTQVLLG